MPIDTCDIVSKNYTDSGQFHKPIFHCDAKPFALGTFVLPNTKDANMLVSLVLGDANFSRHPTQNPNASQWKIGSVGFQTQNSCVGHVHLIFFV